MNWFKMSPQGGGGRGVDDSRTSLVLKGLRYLFSAAVGKEDL